MSSFMVFCGRGDPGSIFQSSMPSAVESKSGPFWGSVGFFGGVSEAVSVG